MNLIDSHAAGWTEGLFVHGPLALEAPEHHWYALLDCAFAPECHGIVQQVFDDAQWRSLYADAPGADDEVITHSPVLLQINVRERSALEHLFRKTDALPMLSFIRSADPLELLAERLSRWCVVNADGQHFVLRFPDTRRLPDVLNVLKPAQLAEFCGSSTAWHFRGRDASWLSFIVPEATAAASSPVSASPVFDGDQCAALIAASEPDEIVAGLLHLTPGYAEKHSPSVLHALAVRALTLADALHLQSPMQRMDLCEALWRQPELAGTPRRQAEFLRALIA